MGLQLIDRAVTVLRSVAESGANGLRLIDVQRSTGMSKPAAHRLLQSLAGNGFLALEPEGLRYRLGHELAVLAWSVTHREQDLRAVTVRSVMDLADESGDTVFLSARSGFDAVCIDRRSGSFPIKALTVDIGTRRPLGVGVTGLSILAALPEDEYVAVMASVEPRLPRYTPATAAQLRSAVRETRRRGYAVSHGMFSEGVRAVAVAIRDFRGEPVAAIGVAAIIPRIPIRRVADLAAALDRERRRIESRLLAGMSSELSPRRAHRSTKNKSANARG